MKANEKREDMFPIYYKGKEYKENDCGEIFLCFYTCVEALSIDCCVYVSEGVWVYPDDSFRHQ